ncbi:MAG: hypothetical protein ACAI25_06240 [Planctomycetota bacterium]
MKRTLFFLLAFVLGTVAATTISRRATAEDPPVTPKAAHEPAPFEYKVFLLDARDFRDKDDWKEAVAHADGNEFRADPVFKSYVLNHLAQEGWEFIQVLPASKENHQIVHFYLRRPRAR